jgi:hypothetical protein
MDGGLKWITAFELSRLTCGERRKEKVCEDEACAFSSEETEMILKLGFKEC